jgi:hypothetical protein
LSFAFLLLFMRKIKTSLRPSTACKQRNAKNSFYRRHTTFDSENSSKPQKSAHFPTTFYFFPWCDAFFESAVRCQSLRHLKGFCKILREAGGSFVGD